MKMRHWFIGIAVLLIALLVVGCVPRSELDKAQSDLAAAQAQIKTLQGNYDSLRSELDKAQSDLAAAQAQIKTLQGNYDSLKNDYASLKSDYDKVKGERDAAQAQVKSLQSDVEKAQSQGKDLQQKIVRAKALAKVLADIFVPALSGKTLTQAEQIALFLQWSVSIKGVGDPTLQLKFVDAIDAKGSGPAMSSFFLYVFESLAKILE